MTTLNLYKRNRKEIENVYFLDLMEQKKYPQAVEELDSALEENRDDLRKIWLKANSLYHDEQLVEAKDLFLLVQTRESSWRKEAQE